MNDLMGTGLTVETVAAVIDPVAFDPISLDDKHPGWECRRERATETAKKVIALACQSPAAPVDGWVHLKAKRVLSVDRGQTTVLCDRDIPTELLILVGSASPAAPVEREPIVCDKCNEVMAAAVGLPVSDQRSSAGSEGEPFMMLSCREAKQCLHNIPGCICDGDPTNG